MIIALSILFVIICVATVLIILSQSSKGAGMEGLLGGAASNVFGSQGGSDVLKKATKGLVAAFFIVSLFIGWYINGSSRQTKASSPVLDKYRQKMMNEKPAASQEDLQEIEVTPTEAKDTDK